MASSGASRAGRLRSGMATSSSSTARPKHVSTRSPCCSPVKETLPMHKSRLAGFIIDCNTPDLDAAAAFWTQALGYPLAPFEGDQGIYRHLDTGPTALHVEVQKVEHPSRVHLDIET